MLKEPIPIPDPNFVCGDLMQLQGMTITYVCSTSDNDRNIRIF